jgi:hypothetical protein
MSLSTTAAARKNEMNASIAVVAIKMFGAAHFAGWRGVVSTGGGIRSSNCQIVRSQRFGGDARQT